MTSFTDKDGEPGNDAFSWFSNYLPAYSLAATDARRRRIVAAPGDSIISTYPIDRLPTKSLPQGYHSMSGTSMVGRRSVPRRAGGGRRQPGGLCAAGPRACLLRPQQAVPCACWARCGL